MTIYEELCALALKMGVSEAAIKNTYNIKDVVAAMSEFYEGDGNGPAIADDVRHLTEVYPDPESDDPES